VGVAGVPSVYVAGASHIKVTVPFPVMASVAVPETLPDTAVIVVDPEVTAVASPFESEALLIVATPVLDELQVTAVVKS
jgi:hypothetical protein